MTVEFDEFLKSPKLCFRLLGFLPFIEGSRFNKEQTIFFIAGMLNMLLTVAQQNVVLIKVFKVSFLDATALAPCVGFCVLASFKIYICWVNRSNIRDILRGLKELLPDDKKTKQMFQVDKFLKLNKLVVYSYIGMFSGGMISFGGSPLVITLFEHFILGLLCQDQQFF